MNDVKRSQAGHLGAATKTMLSAWCGMVLAACGGSEPVAAIQSTASGRTAAVPSARTVQLEGCVVDQHYLPHTGTPVRALSADGRLIGDATSDRRGVYQLRVPAMQTVSVAVAQPDGDALVVPVGSTDLSVGACLQPARD